MGIIEIFLIIIKILSILYCSGCSWGGLTAIEGPGIRQYLYFLFFSEYDKIKKIILIGKILLIEIIILIEKILSIDKILSIGRILSIKKSMKMKKMNMRNLLIKKIWIKKFY